MFARHNRGAARYSAKYPYVRFSGLFEHSRFLLFAIFADDEFKGFLLLRFEFYILHSLVLRFLKSNTFRIR